MKVLVVKSQGAQKVENVKCNNQKCNCVDCNCGSNCTCVACH